MQSVHDTERRDPRRDGTRLGRAGRATRASTTLAVVVALTALRVASAGAGAPPVLPPQISVACPPYAPGLAGYCGDGGPLSLARLAAPRAVAVLPDGDLLIADGQNSVIREVAAADDTVSTVAGDGIIGNAPPPSGQSVSVASFALADPRGVAGLADGSFAVADAGLHAVVLVTPAGQVRTLVAAPTVKEPVGVTALNATTLAVADAGTGRVLEVDVATGASRVLARGLAEPWQLTPDPSVPGGLIVSQASASPTTVDGARTLGDVIRLGPSGERTVIAGPGATGPAGALRFQRVAGVATRGDGVVLVADRHVVYAIYPGGAVAELVTDLGQAEGIAVVDTEVAIADSANNRIVYAAAFLPGERPTCGPSGCVASTPPVATTGTLGPQSAPPPVTPQALGATVCAQGTLPSGVKALQGVKGKGGGPAKILVNFPLQGLLQVSLLAEPNAAEHDLPALNFPQRHTPRTVTVTTKIHGSWYIRVRAPGGCHQTDRPFSL
jgi:hypothetical protein